MKKFLLVVLAFSIPALVLLSVWQAYSFQRLEAEVKTLEDEQKTWFEQNKRKIIGIEYLSSPRRLDQIARDELELEKINPNRVIRITVPETQGEADG